MTASCLSHLECSRCGKTFDAGIINQLCSCGAPLLTRYDMKKLVAVKKEMLNTGTGLIYPETVNVKSTSYP